jgi:hypothetical protein
MKISWQDSDLRKKQETESICRLVELCNFSDKNKTLVTIITSRAHKIAVKREKKSFEIFNFKNLKNENVLAGL